MRIQLSTARKNAGFSTQEQFAQHIGVPRSTLAKWEAGIANPSIEMLIRLSEACRCSVDDLLQNQTEEANNTDQTSAS